jgi:hypothetical protein
MVVLGLCAPALLAQQTDTTPPQLVSLTLSPATVNVTTSDAPVTATVQVTDDLSGIYAIQVAASSPSGKQFVFASFGPPNVALTVTTPITLVIPRFSEPGTWTIANVGLVDRAVNQSNLSSSFLAAAGFPTTFTVIDTDPDTTPPVLNQVTYTPSQVDVSTGPATITVDLSVTDDRSGITFPSPVSSPLDFVLTSPSGKQQRFLSGFSFQLLSGNSASGVWQATLQMARYSEPGQWSLTSLSLIDHARNQKTYSAADFAALGSAIPPLTVTSSPADSLPPQLTTLSFTPAFIDTSLGPQTVQVDIGATDDLSGIAFTPDTPFFLGNWGVYFSSPSGGQAAFTNDSAFSNAAPITGTPLNGIWRFHAQFPQFSEAGNWRPQVFLRDGVRNLSTYTAAQLAALGLPSQLTVTLSSLQPDGIVNPTGGAVADNTFGARAELIVPAGLFTQPTSIAIDVLQSPIVVPLPTGFSAAETFYVNVRLTPQPSFPLPPPGITVVLPLRNPTIPGTQVNLFQIDPATGTLTPALDSSGQPITGLADAGGLTATFHGVSHFSTIVGLLPTAIPVVIDIAPGKTPNVIRQDEDDIPVAIFSSATFDATRIDPASLRLSGAPVATDDRKLRVSIDDVNRDGRKDMVARFRISKLLLGPNDKQAVLEGRTRDGQFIRGTDSVQVQVAKPDDHGKN